MDFFFLIEGAEYHPTAQTTEYQNPRRLGGGHRVHLLVQDKPEALKGAYDTSGPTWIFCPLCALVLSAQHLKARPLSEKSEKSPH